MVSKIWWICHTLKICQNKEKYADEKEQFIPYTIIINLLPFLSVGYQQQSVAYNDTAIDEDL